MNRKLERRITELERRYGEDDELIETEWGSIRASDLRRIIYGNEGQSAQDVINVSDCEP